MKIARLFSGFDGAGEGIRDAGFDLSWGIEYDPKIAAVAAMNGHQVIVSDILDVDPSTLERPDGIHASPACTNASVANSTAELNDEGTKETKLDRDCATKTVQFVEVLRPKIFTLENVWQYRNFQSFAGGGKCEGILPALKRMGYKVGYWHINAADYGVPQTRKRLILAASLDFMPEKTWETHYDPSRLELASPSLFSSSRLPWVGWHEAIEDLIPTLPESQLAPWQLERMPEEIRTMLIGNDRNGDNRDRLNLSSPEDPSFTVTSSNGSKLKGFLMDGKLSTSGDNKVLQIKNFDQPSGTIVSSYSAYRDTRAQLSIGRVVKMTSRALARFQTFSDSYKLSGNNPLDVKGIGNACPPLLFRRIYEGLKSQMQ